MRVYVLAISHRHGTDVSVFAKEEAARATLVGYCREWWETDVGDEPMPESDSEVVSQYFERVEDDYYEITPRDVIE